ncbi:MAG: hypothetical protein D6679_11215 [Candidatus Hydrogenedentota bacterium]|nr:MAG: hypothetical protein D6679_11215 [Candidatus Hydrogenedentota bacterium]
MIDYRFEKEPFGVAPDPGMVFRHSGFADAFEALEEGIHRGKGFLVITGDVGSGKTTLMRSFLSRDDSRLVTAAVLNTGLGPDDLLSTIAEDLGLSVPPAATRKDLINLLYDHLLKTFASGKQTAVFIDEAQNLSLESLEVVRMLSNLETETDKLLQIVLFGQNELRVRLAEPELVQLRSRIAVHRHLTPLSLEETTEYVRHRLAAANPAIPVSFDHNALKRMYRLTGGLPRRINILAGVVLKKAAESESEIVTEQHVRAAEEEFASLDEIGAEERPETGGMPWSTIGAWFVLIIALVSLTVLRFRRMREESPPPELPVSSAVRAPSSVLPASREEAPSPERLPLLAFFRANAESFPFDPGILEIARPEAVARSLHLRWRAIQTTAAELRAIRLPALVRLRALPPDQFALLEPVQGADSESVLVTTAERSSRLPWELVDLAPGTTAVLLLPETMPERLLEFGMTSDSVLHLQEALVRFGNFSVTPNGHFGPTTLAAVRDFQAQVGLTEDGVVGPRTLGALLSRGLW